MKKSSICLCSKVESLARDDVHQSSEASPRSRHSAWCLPQQFVLYYHDVELLEQERKPARMSVKTYFLLFRTMAIDRLSHVSQERVDYLPVFAERCSVTKILTHDSATAPGLSEVRTQRNFFQYGSRSRNKMALRFAYGQLAYCLNFCLPFLVQHRHLNRGRCGLVRPHVAVWPVDRHSL